VESRFILLGSKTVLHIYKLRQPGTRQTTDATPRIAYSTASLLTLLRKTLPKDSPIGHQVVVHPQITAIQITPIDLPQARRYFLAEPGEGSAMAQVIQFYVPATFQSKTKWLAPHLRGKVIQFAREVRKLA
jgi:hypothetical protein